MLSTSQLEQIFFHLSQIKYLRIHTKTPVVLPSRIDEKFCLALHAWKYRFKRLHMVLHINHINEIDPAVERAITRLRGEGVTLLSQTVLLKGINDTPEELTRLFEKLIYLGVTPYYLHHPEYR